MLDVVARNVVWFVVSCALTAGWSAAATASGAAAVLLAAAVLAGRLGPLSPVKRRANLVQPPPSSGRLARHDRSAGQL